MVKPLVTWMSIHLTCTSLQKLRHQWIGMTSNHVGLMRISEDKFLVGKSVAILASHHIRQLESTNLSIEAVKWCHVTTIYRTLTGMQM